MSTLKTGEDLGTFLNSFAELDAPKANLAIELAQALVKAHCRGLAKGTGVAGSSIHEHALSQGVVLQVAARLYEKPTQNIADNMADAESIQASADGASGLSLTAGERATLLLAAQEVITDAPPVSPGVSSSLPWLTVRTSGGWLP